MLFHYQQQVLRLMHDTQQVTLNLYDATDYINEARLQIALAAECIRQPATFAMVVGQQPYAFSGMSFIAAPTLPAGLGGVANVRMAFMQLITGGLRRIQLRSWEWFNTYYLARSAPVPGPPQCSSRLQPGLSGTMWFAPAPDAAYPLQVDAVAYPAPLALESDPEALPSPWTDAVPFFAAYLAFLQNSQPDAAAAMWAEYQKFEHRGTQLTTPTWLPRSYPGGRGAAAASSRMTLTGAPAMIGGGGRR
jgi:hypothetical protein